MNAYENSHLSDKQINSEHNSDTLTFLKSNYKYKRRGDVKQYALPCKESVKNYESDSQFTFSLILSLFIVFVRNIKQHTKEMLSRQETAADNANINEELIDSDEKDHQRNDDKVSTSPQKCQQSTAYQNQQQQQCLWPSALRRQHEYRNSIALLLSSSTSSSTSITTTPSTSSTCQNYLAENCASRFKTLSIPLMWLFIILALGVSHAEAGACWQTKLNNGKCNEIYDLNITKAECCDSGLEFHYTDRDLTSVEYFFATAIGGGMECSPCIENCKNVKCGPNKKCVKRKGRPKCICAPECGAATRRKQRSELKLFDGEAKHHSEELKEKRTEQLALMLEKSPRDVRSLSSEITNINLGLEDHNQRKVIIMKNHRHSQQSQQKPQINNNNSNKREPNRQRLVIASNVEHVSKPTTRRLQIISNVRNQHDKNGDGGRFREGFGSGAHRKRKNDDLTSRSSSVETGRGSFMSRHKSSSNSNNNNNDELQPSQNQQQETPKLQQNNKSGRARHMHQNQANSMEHAPNHNSNNDEVETEEKHRDNEHAQRHHQQFHHRKRKQHHHNRSRKLKDHNNNNNNNNGNSTRKTTTKTPTSSSSSSSTSPYSSASSTSSETESARASASVYNNAQSTTLSSSTSSLSLSTKNTKILQTLSTTPVNSTTSADRRRLLNHGSNSATSSTTTLPAVGVPAHHAGGINSGSNILAQSDDLTLLDEIYDKFNMHGFPNQLNEITHNMQVGHPVCGTDGRTYNTECQLKKRACRTDNSNLQVAYRGHCKTSCNGVKCLNGLTCVEDHYTIPHCIACKIVCPQDDDDDEYNDNDDNKQHHGVHHERRSDVIDPSRAVCGVDGKTYKSICDINRMICKIGRSIAVAYPGPCRADRVTCSDINCGPKNTCLVDLLTHEPRCVSCRYKCARKRRPSSLRFEEGKICGVNNRSYNSWCEMRKDSCATGFFIDVKSPGECQ